MMTTPNQPPVSGTQPDAQGQTTDPVLDRDVACPACTYNLRGLHGPVVNCPECGEHCDIVKLITMRWTGPWWSAPGFNTVLLPTPCALVVVAIFLIAPAMHPHTDTPWILAAIWLVAIAIWGYLMWRTWILFRGVRGPALALLGHGVLLGYVVGVLGTALAVVRIIVILINQSQHPTRILLGQLGWPVLLTLVFLAILVLARKCERFIAACCIRRHLAKIAAPDLRD